MSKRAHRVRKDIFERAIVTETPPFETPIIFNNHGFYKHSRRRSKEDAVGRSIFDKLISETRSPLYTVPYKYRIRKDESNYRILSLLHPSAQWNIAKFYQEYEGLICHFCSRSKMSIRSPVKVASTVFIRSSSEVNNGIKDEDVALEKIDTTLRFSPSYFAYRGYDRLYRFFNSDWFVELESKFPILIKMDVTKCFDSIYTHSIAWATRNKTFSKDNPKIVSFGNNFDVLMQKSNSNETNGIPIGSETSRIFAEIIFQDIDFKTEGNFAKELTLGTDYQIARYVDDIFIFAKNSDTARKIQEKYTENLNSYNLHVNHRKTDLLTRPFSPKNLNSFEIQTYA